MSGLIERQAAIYLIQHAGKIGKLTCIDILKDLPDADAVEVVRCKDCKWSVEHYDTDGNVPYWVCKNWDGGTDADGYCHEAERKEE